MTSLRQKAVLAVLGVVVLYCGLVGAWFLNLDRKSVWCTKSWADAMKKYDKACREYQEECKLIAEKQKWTDAYEDEKRAMPTFEVGAATDTTWLRKLDAYAATNYISVAQSQANKEVVAGEVLELPIDIKSWEGALESLVKFMYALENADDGMYDFSELHVKPSAKRGYLKGSMTVTCAYMRR